MAGYPRPSLIAVQRPTVIDIAWAAGIYEGEGSASRTGTNKTSLRLVVVQKDRWLLYQLMNLFGGSVHGPYPPRRDVSTWQVCGPRARGFAYTIFPFLSPRRRQQIKTILGVV